MEPRVAGTTSPSLGHLLDVALLDNFTCCHGNQVKTRIQEEFGLSACRPKCTDRPAASFQQRLESFVVKKADILFQTRPVPGPQQLCTGKDEEDYYAVLPPLEQFMDVPTLLAKQRFFKLVRPGNIVVGKIISMKDFGFFINLLCLNCGGTRDIQDMDITALCPSSDLPSHGAHQRPIEYYHTNDIIQAVVKTVSPVDERLVVSLRHTHLSQALSDVTLGIITSDDLPVHFRRSQDLRTSQNTYDLLLQRVWGFSNPSNVSYLGTVLDIGDNPPHSLMRGLHRCPFPQEDFAESLLKQQSSHWALSCVGSGVQHFKAGRHVEAMQCLEKALTFDPVNAEALVVRGALYANKNSLLRAMEDFAQALKLNPAHNNARKYMCETLLARGKQLLEEGEDEDAMTSYQKALVINPDLQEAKDAVEHVRAKQEKMKMMCQVDLTTDRKEEPAELSFAQSSKEKLQKLLEVEGSSKDKSRKRKKRKRKSSSSSEEDDGNRAKKKRRRDSSPKSKSDSKRTTSTGRDAGHVGRSAGHRTHVGEHSRGAEELTTEQHGRQGQGGDVHMTGQRSTEEQDRRTQGQKMHAEEQASHSAKNRPVDEQAGLMRRQDRYNVQKHRYLEGQVRHAEGNKHTECQSVHKERQSVYEEGPIRGKEEQRTYKEGQGRYSQGLSVFEEGQSRFKEQQMKYNEGQSRYKEEQMTYKEGHSTWYKEGQSRYKEGQSRYKEQQTMYNDGQSWCKERQRMYEEEQRTHKEGPSMHTYQEGHSRDKEGLSVHMYKEGHSRDKEGLTRHIYKEGHSRDKEGLSVHLYKEGHSRDKEGLSVHKYQEGHSRDTEGLTGHMYQGGHSRDKEGLGRYKGEHSRYMEGGSRRDYQRHQSHNDLDSKSAENQERRVSRHRSYRSRTRSPVAQHSRKHSR